MIIYLLSLWFEYKQVFKWTKDNVYAVYYVDNFSHRVHINGCTLPLFTFQQFYRFFVLNPDAWCIESRDNQPHQIPIRYIKNEIESFIFEDPYSFYPIYFTNVWEYRKYKRWAKKYLKKRFIDSTTIERIKNTKEICELVQNDIDKEYAKAREVLKNGKLIS